MQRQYVVVVTIPEDQIEGDDSIEAICSDINGLLGTFLGQIAVRPLSEIMAC